MKFACRAAAHRAALAVRSAICPAPSVPPWPLDSPSGAVGSFSDSLMLSRWKAVLRVQLIVGLKRALGVDRNVSLY